MTSHSPEPQTPTTAPVRPASTGDQERVGMTPWLWLLGALAIGIGIVCGFVMSVASLHK